jgi:hypothetical protein
MTLEQLKKHCWVDERGDHQMPVDEVKALIDNTVEEIIKIAEGIKTREMQLGENRSKYLAFERGENHFRCKIIKAIKK